MRTTIFSFGWRPAALIVFVILVASGTPRVGAQNGAIFYGDTIRFLEQATFGPTTDLVDHVQRIGYEAFLEEQFSLPRSDYPQLAPWPATRPMDCTGPCQRDNYTMYPLQAHFFKNALYGRDQLRQRVAFALSQILVVSGRDVTLSSWMRPYQQLLYAGAFGNYRQLLYDVTLNAAMGAYLDMVNNVKFNPATGIKPNENYAREILQLFSIGLFKLNQDGTHQTDALGDPLPTYGEEEIEEFSKVFTGWTFAPQFGQGTPNYIDPMRVRTPEATYHDRETKRLLNGVVLPAGQSTLRDLNDAIDNIFNHPNVGPFICKQLIQHLVTSNPSPDYVWRVALVFNSPGQRGDLKAVIRAILLDREARQSTQNPNYGHLREPVLFMTGLLRAFNPTSDGVLNSLVIGDYQIGSSQMGQDVFNAPSVFNFYPPDHQLPDTGGVLGPEFRIHSSVSALRRSNFAQRMIFSNIPSNADRPMGTRIDLSFLLQFNGNTSSILDYLDLLLMHRSTPPQMLASIAQAVESIPGSQPLLRAQTALYLFATSSLYQVER